MLRLRSRSGPTKEANGAPTALAVAEQDDHDQLELDACPPEDEEQIVEQHHQQQFEPDRFSALAPELQLRIMSYLRVRDLCNLEQVCGAWRRNRLLNEVWWRHCMAQWWAKADRPRRMERADHKKSWKLAYSRLTPVQTDAPMQDVDVKAQQQVARAARQPQWDAAPELAPGEYKHQMRAFYKSIRSKPLGKRAARVDKHTAFVWADD